MLYSFSDSEIEKIIVHHVGNSGLDEGCQLSKREVGLKDELLKKLLNKYFLSSFKNESIFKFFHDEELELNEVFRYASAIFDNPENFQEQSEKIAKHLYSQSKHPKIKSGELYIVLFWDCKFQEEYTIALGIFKSENKDTFLKVYPHDDTFEIDHEEGININKLDKGCIIFNSAKEEGYKVVITDNTNQNSEAQFWKDDFLGLKPLENNFFHTKNYLDLCKSFSDDVFSVENNVEKTDQILFLEKSGDYFKKNEKFDQKEFQTEVLADRKDFIEAFQEHKREFEENREVTIYPEFEISEQAYNKNKNNFKSVLKLDKNFHVYIHGSHEMIEKGFDEERVMNYYKLYYKEEK